MAVFKKKQKKSPYANSLEKLLYPENHETKFAA
jgi:hypothetical protein